MKDQNKTKKQLLEELEVLRYQLAQPRKGETKHKPVKRALQESEETFRTLAENANDGILVAIGDGLLAYANKRASKILGYSVAELLKSTIKDLVHPDEFKKIMERYRKRLAGKPVPSQYETMVVRKDGRGLPIELTAAKTTWHGQPANLVIARDIAERKQAEEALPESEERYRRLVDNSLMGIGISCGNEIIFANLALLRLFGYENLEEFKKIPLLNHVAPASHKHIAARMEKIAQEDPVPVEFEFEILRKDGLTKTLLASSQHFTLDGKTYSQTTFQDITERKRAESVLKESEERYRHLVEGSPAIVWSFSDKHGTLFASSRVKSILGHSPDFLCENPWLWNKSIHPDDQDSVAQSIKDFESGKDLNVEYRIKDSSGNWRWFQDRSIGKRIEGEATIIEGISIDITERKQAEEALRENETILRALINAPTDSVLLLDSRGVILDLNKIGAERLGKSKDELIGTLADDSLPEDIAKRRRSLISQIFETKREVRFEDERDGIWYDTVAHPIMDKDGAVGRLAIIARDITDRKRAEEALRESEERVKSIFRAAPIGIGVVTNRVLMDVNARVCEMTGYRREELVGSSARVLYPTQDDFDYVGREKYGQIAEKGMGSVETRWMKKDGTIIDVLLSSTPIDPSDLSHGVTFTALDITERKRAEEKLRESEKKYRTVVEISPDGIAIASKGRHVYVNQSLVRIFGVSSPDDLLGKSVMDYVHPDYREIAGKRIETAIKREAFAPLIEEKMIRADGTVIQTEVAAAPFEYQGEQAVLAIIRDITERKQAEQALRESEERFRLAFENANTGVSLVDLDGNLTRVNNKMCEIFGYTKEELERMTVNDIAHPEDVDKSPEFIQKTLRGEIDRSVFEKRYFHKKGHVVTCQVSSSLVRDANGSPSYFISHVNDITERKQTEEALKERQETIKAIIETSQDWIWAIDRHGMHTYSNPAIERILGYEPEEIVGSSSLDLMHEDDKEMVESIVRDCEKKRHGWNNLLLRWRHKNGSYRYLESNAVPILNDKGDLLGFQGVDRDITERKKAEEALQKEQEISLSILENAPYGVVLIDKGGEYIYINPEFTNITGYTLQDIPTGTDWFQKAFSDPKDRKRMLKLWKEDRSKANMINREFSINRKDGKTYEIETRSTFLRDGRAVMVLHDTTEQKRAEEEMKSLQEQLRQSQKMEAIGRLAGGIAHDFNNLLTIIKGYSQLSLIELKEDTPLRGNIEHIHTATDRAADLVRQLLAFSRRQILEMKVWDLNTILTNLHNMLRRLIGEDIELTTILGEELGRVKTDLGWIEQAIMNLVVNAKDAMPSGGKLTIETENAVLDEAYVSGRVGVKPGRFVMLSVSDTGVGMTPEVRERLFEPFFSTKEKDKGTGLGLSTVYGIVKQSGGDIWVYSEPGKGSTFKIYLPRVDEPSEQPREKVLDDELLRGSETILLVEDEEEVRKLAVRVLERQGYKVLAARDGDEALLICERHQGPIHLMLTDVVMPRMNGHELAERLEPFYREMKVLYMSGYTDNAIVLHGVLVEGVHYIQKPFTVDALTKKVREVLGQ